MKKRRGTAWAAALCSVLFLCPLLSLAVGTAARTVPETAGNTGTVYVAGNPDWYPIEYYDPDTKRYEGILPEILDRVGERTGLDFIYISSGTEDQRLLLAREGRVEIISGYARDAEELRDHGMTGSKVILTLDEQETEVCFAFTRAAGDSLISTVEDALDEISDQETAGIAVRFAMEHPEPSYPRWVLPAGLGGLALLAAVVAILAVQRRKYKKVAEHDTQYDPATGLGNKEYLVRRFKADIPDKYRDLYCTAFIGFDIARVNQYYSEAEAEDQLRFAAGELVQRTGSHEILARVSGGGFAVVRPSGGRLEIETWIRQLLTRLNRYAEKYGKDYHPDFYAGIYMLEPTDRDCETVLHNARHGYQLALDHNTAFVFSDAAQLAHETEKLQLKKHSVTAIQNREFKMYLQFIVHARDGAILGAEALSRWEHPQKGLLSPGRYIQLMESEKTIGKLDFYMFEEACRQLEAWQKAGRALTLSCNFTRLTIDREDFVPHLQKISGRYAFDYSNLIIEITEDVMESDRESAFANISKCKDLGFQIALDDAGSGCTSFSDLRDYPIDIIKIDRSLLNTAVDARGTALLQGVIVLAHSLQMQVLCEGVETAQQVELLRRLDCDYMQGYYFYRPLPQEEANRFLSQRNETAAEGCGAGGARYG